MLHKLWDLVDKNSEPIARPPQAGGVGACLPHLPHLPHLPPRLIARAPLRPRPPLRLLFHKGAPTGLSTPGPRLLQPPGDLSDRGGAATVLERLLASDQSGPQGNPTSVSRAWPRGSGGFRGVGGGKSENFLGDSARPPCWAPPCRPVGRSTPGRCLAYVDVVVVAVADALAQA